MAPKLLERTIQSLFTMKISPILAAATISATTTALGLVPGLPTSASHNATTAQNQLNALISRASTAVKSYKRSLNSTCTLQNAQIRREWDTLSAKERIAYMNAIRCLQTKSASSIVLSQLGAFQSRNLWSLRVSQETVPCRVWKYLFMKGI